MGHGGCTGRTTGAWSCRGRVGVGSGGGAGSPGPCPMSRVHVGGEIMISWVVAVVLLVVHMFHRVSGTGG